jgi:SAM-dependent methyltransferase
MRRVVFLAGAAAVVAGLVVLVSRSRGTASAGVPGVLPGRFGSRVNAWMHRPVYALMAAALDLRPDDDLLDVGCGSGDFLAEHAAQVRHVAGLDLSASKVGFARRRLADRIAAGTAEIVEGDAAALPWEDGRFSVVTSMDAFPFFPDPERALSEMHRVLRPGGRAVVGFGWKVAEGTETHTVMGGFRVWDEAEVWRMTEEAGFTDVAISYGRAGGDSRLLNLLGRLWGSVEARVVRGIMQPLAADSPVSVTPSLVGSGAG